MRATGYTRAACTRRNREITVSEATTRHTVRKCAKTLQIDLNCSIRMMELDTATVTTADEELSISNDRDHKSTFPEGRFPGVLSGLTGQFLSILERIFHRR